MAGVRNHQTSVHAGPGLFGLAGIQGFPVVVEVSVVVGTYAVVVVVVVVVGGIDVSLEELVTLGLTGDAVVVVVVVVVDVVLCCTLLRRSTNVSYFPDLISVRNTKLILLVSAYVRITILEQLFMN